jgi:hypothetical protein
MSEIDTLALRIVLYDELALEFPHLLPDAKYAKQSKDRKIKERAAKTAFTSLVGLLLGARIPNDLRTLLYLWCTQQGKLQINRRRGRRAETTKHMLIHKIYSQKVKGASRGQIESVIAELMRDFGLKRRQLFHIIKSVDPTNYRSGN